MLHKHGWSLPPKPAYPHLFVILVSHTNTCCHFCNLSPSLSTSNTDKFYFMSQIRISSVLSLLWSLSQNKPTSFILVEFYKCLNGIEVSSLLLLHSFSHSLATVTCFRNTLPVMSLTSLFLYNNLEICFFLFMATPAAYRSFQPGAELKLQLPAYSTVMVTLDPSCICDLCHSLRQGQTLNPLSKARDQISSLVDTMSVLNPLSHNGNSSIQSL